MNALHYKMKYPTFRFVFDRKHIATKTQKGPVQIEVYYNRQRKWVSTGIRLYADQWDDKRKAIHTSNAILINEKLDAIMANIVDKAKEAIRCDTKPSIDDICEAVQNSSDNYIDYVSRKIVERRNIAETTRRQHATLIPMLYNFGKIKSMDDLTLANIQAFDDFLRAKGLSQPTIHNYHKRNKIFVLEAMRDGLIKNNPYARFKADRGKTEKRKYLTIDDIGKVKACNVLSKAIDKTKDLFLFQCYTGLAYSDLAAFDFNRDTERRDNRYVIRGRRTKTGEDYFVALIEPAMVILRKYNYVLPIVSNQKYNANLKVLACYAGLHTPLTSHMARHTFAVLALNSGVQIEVVAKMLGHTNIRTTQIYAKILSTTVESGFDTIEKRLRSID